ncbi:Uncharacterised protein [Mycobacteroides abscessus subsp. abscessus]|nr:Uncharacterised protein [Mycobacteroides abscessus subsp. abscessus]
MSRWAPGIHDGRVIPSLGVKVTLRTSSHSDRTDFTSRVMSNPL